MPELRFNQLIILDPSTHSQHVLMTHYIELRAPRMSEAYRRIIKDLSHSRNILIEQTNFEPQIPELN